MKKSIIVAASAVLFCGNMFAQTPGQVKILFDNVHAETSGNTADWCIDADQWNMNWGSTVPYGYTCGSCVHSNPQQYPTPAQTAITATTVETYWTGALSYWAIDCVNKGYWVESLPYTGFITYGSTTNAQDLSNYNVFVVDEPNTVFTAAEKTAIMNFVKNGGSLFAISDHDGSDRNSDGWDSPHIWNDLFTNNTVQNNAFGYTFALESFSQTSTNVATSTSDSIIHGPYGTVAKVQWSSGTCINMNPTQNPSVKAHVWKTGSSQSLDSTVLCVTARYGCGKIASIGDSSPTDDGTGDPSNTNSQLYTGYTGDASGNHRPWLMNMMIWLAEGTNCTTASIKNSATENNGLSIYPNPTNGQVIINFTNNSENNAALSLVNMNGQVISIAQTHQKNSNQETFIIDTTPLAAGVYYCKVQLDNKISIKKLIVLGSN